MTSALTLRHEVSSYLILAEELKAQYHDIDEETLADTLEGVSDLPDLIQAVIRSALEDEALIVALKGRLDEMDERMTRFKHRSEKKRALARWAMLEARIERLQAPDFSISIRQGVQKLDITDEARLPEEFFIPQPARLDRSGLIAALKRGAAIDGAVLVVGEPGITVRVR